MRLAALCLSVLCALASGRLAQPLSAPFVPVSVSYEREPPELNELRQIRALGFNSIKSVVSWATVEQVRGQYRFDRLGRLLAIADQADLRVILQIDTAAAPGWVGSRYADGRVVGKDGTPASPVPRFCLDHPGVRADMLSFIGAVSGQASRSGAFYAVDVGSEPRVGFCECQFTQQRFGGWLARKYGAAADPPRTAADRAAFLALKLRDDLKMLADASAPRGARFVASHAFGPWLIADPASWSVDADAWLMRTVVDFYGTTVALPVPSARPGDLPLALDVERSASAERGWWAELPLDMPAGPPAESTPDAEGIRLRSWSAIARGARAINYAGSITAAGPATTFAGVITRNPALFAPLRPRPSRIAVVFNPLVLGLGDSGGLRESVVGFYQALFERNVSADFIHPDDVASGDAANYRAIYVASARLLPPPVSAALSAYVRAGGTVINGDEDRSSLAKHLASYLELAARAGVTPDVRIVGANGPVETRFLESSNVIMIIGLNHSDRSQKVTMTFAPDTQEAIWQNMETGSAVNFVAGPDGPTYTYWFRPRDALVLMIRKTVR
jgi:beta-galactosidase